MSRWLAEGVGGVGRYMIYRIFPGWLGLHVDRLGYHLSGSALVRTPKGQPRNGEFYYMKPMDVWGL